ncbi:uncharacterized protein G2W53_017939 [Senna tora]|uniref:Uncharacterized protein n=1 Tax=Senna tora TaxID=362788 RepID=A0A834WKL7_9FABA|nr:uncharacterized protein G2W53_017939 [Senna tora]
MLSDAVLDPFDVAVSLLAVLLTVALLSKPLFNDMKRQDARKG